MQKPQITFVIHDILGGVAYMNHQIIEHSNMQDFFDVHIILVRAKEGQTKRFTEKFTASSTTEFVYSNFDNRYTVLKRLNSLLNKHKGIIVTNDGIELDAIQHFGTKSFVYSIVHDFYNMRLAVAFLNIVDVFLCHTQTFTKTLKSSGRSSLRVDYLPHGVRIPSLDKVQNNEKNALKLLFIGRLVESKGTLLLREIESILRARNIEVTWTIIGSGELEEQLKKQWEGCTNVTFLKPASNDEVLAIAKECDVFVNPSIFEGYGIALLEAMACGLAPIVYDLPVGIAAELPENTGFRVKNGVEEFADKIEILHKDRSLLADLKRNARIFAEKDYDITHTAKMYLKSFQNTPAERQKSFGKMPSSFSVFDRKRLPNYISMLLKKTLKK